MNNKPGRSRSWSLSIVVLVVLAAAGILGGLQAFDKVTRPSPVEQPARAKTLVVTDDVGRKVTLTLPVTRAITLNRYILEMVRAVGGTDVIVGMDAAELNEPQYWPTLTKDMVAGQNQDNPNFERIIALKPGVVFLPRNADWQKVATVLEPFGIPLVVITAWDILKHEENVDLLGRIFEQPERAGKLNAFYRHYRNILDERLKGVRRKRVYIEETRPNITGIEGSGWHTMIQTGGGTNVFEDIRLFSQPPGTNPHSFQIDPEEILARRPEAIIKLQPGQYKPHPREFSVKVLTDLVARSGFADLPAVQTGSVYHLSYYMASGCSKITGALQIAKWLYPDRFEDIDPEEAMRVWLEDYQHVPAFRGYSVSLAQIRGQ